MTRWLRTPPVALPVSRAMLSQRALLPTLGSSLACQLDIRPRTGARSPFSRGVTLASTQGLESVATMTNMIVFFIGTLLVVAGLAFAASRMGVSSVWILAGALVIIGIGLMGGIVKTRQKDPAV